MVYRSVWRCGECRSADPALQADRGSAGRNHCTRGGSGQLHAFHLGRPRRHQMVNAVSAPIRVRSLGPHTTIGEMGLITRQPRSATMQAELVSVLYELNASAYERIKCENPGLSHALL